MATPSSSNKSNWWFDVYDISEEAVDEMIRDIGYNFDLLPDNRNKKADLHEHLKINYAIAGVYKEDRARTVDKYKGEALCIKVSVLFNIIVKFHFPLYGFKI